MKLKYILNRSISGQRARARFLGPIKHVAVTVAQAFVGVAALYVLGLIVAIV
jgi:hypothetical protein